MVLKHHIHIFHSPCRRRSIWSNCPLVFPKALQFNDHLLLSDLMDYVTSGPVVAMELMRTDAVKHWRRMLGPTDPLVARSDCPDTIRAKFGKDMTKNAAHGSDSTESAERVRDKA